MPAPCWHRMLLRPCWTGPSCQCHDCLGAARAAQGYWAITNSNILCPMSCQSPALPHCHSLPLAMSLMRLPREHCTIINYIIIIFVIAWGCPQLGCPCCHLPLSTQLPSGCSQSCSQGTHQAQHLPAALQPLEVSAEPEPGGGQKGFLSQGLSRPCCLSASLRPSSSNLAPVQPSPEPGGNEGKAQAG